VLLSAPAASWAGALPIDVPLSLPLTVDGAHPALLLAQLGDPSLDPVFSLGALLSNVEWPGSADFQNGFAEVRGEQGGDKGLAGVGEVGW